MSDRYPERRAELTPERAQRATVLLLEIAGGEHPRTTGTPARDLARRKLRELRLEMDDLRLGVRTRLDLPDDGWVEVTQ